jgi:hypothetical protein
LLPPLGPGDLESPSDSDLIVCRSSIPHSYDSSLIDFASPDQSIYHHMKYGKFTSPFGTVNPHLHDFLDFEFPSDEFILEPVTMVSITWEELHMVCVFFPFERVSKLTIEETFRMRPTVGST